MQQGVRRPPSGHVFRVERIRGPVWYAKYRLPDGRQVQRKIGPAWPERGRPPAGYFTKRQAEEWLQETLGEARRGTLPGMVRTGVTFAAAAAEFLRYIEHDRGRKRMTVKTYASIVRAQLLPAFGSLRLEDVTGGMVQAWVAGTGATSGATVCGSSLGCLYTINYDGSDPQQLPFQGDNPAWAPDGTALLYTGIAASGGNQPTVCGCGPQVPSTQMFTTYLADPAATNTPVPMPDGTVSTDTGSYSADAADLVYSALDPTTDQWSVYVADSDGTSPQPLQGSIPSSQPQHPAFSADEQNVVFDALSPTDPQIHSVYEAAVDPGGATLLTPDPSSSYGYFTVLPNGAILTSTVYCLYDDNDIITYGDAIACGIAPGATGCSALPNLPTGLTDLTTGTTTEFGPNAVTANGSASGSSSPNAPGSQVGDLGLVRPRSAVRSDRDRQR